MTSNPDTHSETHPEPVRRKIYFSGRVQGVGFRFTVESVASRFTVTGYVRNLPDGRVELVAEAPFDELDRFQSAVEEAMRSNIREVHAVDTPATGQFTSFGIDY